jgi:hypothetical protein
MTPPSASGRLTMSRDQAGTRIRTTAAVRAGWAVILLARPERLLRAGGGGPVPPAAVAAVRVLGVRHLLQAGASAGPATGSVAGLGALVDMAHAGSCVGLAIVSPRWRRAALADALVEAGFAAAGWSSRSRPGRIRRRF